MYEIIYASAGRQLFDLEQLGKLLEAARLHNQALSVSGILLYEAGSFVQILEGEEAVVRALFDKIARDPRHYRVQVLREGHVDARSFSEWTMGFVTLDAHLMRAFPRRHGLSSNGSLLTDQGAALEMLEAFRSGRLQRFILG